MIKPLKELLDMYIIERCVISASETIAKGDAVLIDTATPNTVKGAAGGTDIILGTVVNIKNGIAGGNIPLQTDSITVGVNNATVEKISVDVLASQNICVYVADLDDEAGTTPNSEYKGYFDLSATDNGLLDESSYTASTEGQFLSYGLLPGSTTKVFGVWTKLAQA